MAQIIPAPINTRQMLLAFAMYNAERGLPPFVRRFDLTGVTRRQIYFNTLGRQPGPAVAVDGPGFDPLGATISTLNGQEFQTRLREIVLAAFPEKRRLIFVHVPKCAGTDLQVTLARRYPSLNIDLCNPEATPKPRLFEHIHRFATGIALSDSIAVTGHVPLRWYLDHSLARFEDDVFTSVRHPRDILYSFVSFILTRILDARDTPRRDVAHWLGELGLERIDPDPSPATLADLGSRLLRVRTPNLICTYLGAGTAASAFASIVQSDIEVTDIARYSAWRRGKFGFEPPQRLNASRPLFTPQSASAADRSFIEDLISEDMIVYEAIQERLKAQDGLSIRGRVFG